MHPKTLHRKLKEHKLIIPRGLITPEVQKEIYFKLGFKEAWLELLKEDKR